MLGYILAPATHLQPRHQSAPLSGRYHYRSSCQQCRSLLEAEVWRGAAVGDEKIQTDGGRERPADTAVLSARVGIAKDEGQAHQIDTQA